MIVRPAMHVLMRYADHAQDFTIDTIQAHQDLIERRGAVWLGKFGKKLASEHVLRVNQQCKEGIPTTWYLVKKRGGAYQVDPATVTAMARTLPRGQGHLVPPYYEERRLLRHIGFWTKVTDIVGSIHMTCAICRWLGVGPMSLTRYDTAWQAIF